MKTTLDKTTRDELIARINALNENSVPQWGKMNVYQMLKHCVLWEEMVAGKVKCKRSFVGLIFGKMALKGLLKEENLMTRNAPSSSELVVKDNDGNVADEKKKLIAYIAGHDHISDSGFMHPFFGQMTKAQIGYLVYKHVDHHLRQFNG
jgi:hypothetical protein